MQQGHALQQGSQRQRCSPRLCCCRLEPVSWRLLCSQQLRLLSQRSALQLSTASSTVSSTVTSTSSLAALSQQQHSGAPQRGLPLRGAPGSCALHEALAAAQRTAGHLQHGQRESRRQVCCLLGGAQSSSASGSCSSERRRRSQALAAARRSMCLACALLMSWLPPLAAGTLLQLDELWPTTALGGNRAAEDWPGNHC